MRTNKSITLTLGKQQQVLDAMVESGDYESASEAVRGAWIFPPTGPRMTDVPFQGSRARTAKAS